MASPGSAASGGSAPLAAERQPRAGGSGGRVRPVIVDIGFRYQLTRLALIFERLAAPVTGLAAVAALFAICAWSGLFWALGPTGRMLLALAFLPLLGLALWQFRDFRLPGMREIEQRLDRSRPEAHRPLETLADNLAGKGDSFAAALWQVHRLRAAEAAGRLVARPGDAKLRRKDPFALRFVIILALIVTAFIAGDERQTRLASAFDWSTPKVPPVPPRLDAWIDPPSYTGRPPIFLTGAVTIGPGEVIRAPVGATLTVRSTIAVPAAEARSAAPGEARGPLIALRHDAGLAEPPAPKADPDQTARPKPAGEKPGVETLRRIIRADSQVSVLREGQEVAAFRFAVIPDLPPKVTLNEVRAEASQPDRQSPGGIRVNYTLEDDYGIARADLVIERVAKPGQQAPRTLLPPPAAAISTRLGPGETAIATEDHPWAGEEVAIRLVVEDDLGQKSESETMRVTLPRRPFSQALARALVEQRRNLVFGPDNSQDVVFAFDALLYEPERFMPKVSDYLALDSIRSGIRSATEQPRREDEPALTSDLFERKAPAARPPSAVEQTDRKLVEMVERIYELALFLENGDMTDAERRLREAEARLREALEREAPQNEIRRLSEELRRAMEQFLREFAERALREQDRNAEQDRQPNPSDRFLTQRDLNDMLRRIEEMARSGNMDEARRLLNELRQLMENLRMARRQDMDPRRRELGEQLEELDRLQREQRDLRDRTFRQGQQRNQQGRQQQGQRQQGQRQPGQRQPGQQGQEQGDGESEEDLQRQQQALRERLRQLRDRLKQRGMQEGEGMGEAEDGMGDAEGQLGQGRPGQATEGQQRALDGMGRAAQGMAQQLEQQMGEGEGEGEGPGFGQPGPGNRGRADNRTDPLGRPQPNARRDVEDSSRVQVPDQNTVQRSISERAEQVLRELRRRLGDFERPREELDYLERLLRQR